MKQCSICSRTYDEDTQSFCLEDGARLVTAYDREATQVINSPHAREVSPPPPPPPAVVAPPPRNANPALYIGIALVALLVGGGLVALFRSGRPNTTTAQPVTTSSPTTSDTSTPLTSPKRNSEPIATPNSDRPAPATAGPPSSEGTWFVVLGSFPKNRYEKANERLQSIQAAGHAANIVDTDNYPGFRRGLWAVVMGPYSKAEARTLARRIKSVRSDAYAKSGW